jgi:DNA-binding MarR family transcriptional regulator
MKLSDSQFLLLKTIYFKANKAYLRDLNLRKQIINNQLSELEKHGLISICGHYSTKYVEITEAGKRYLANTQVGIMDLD